MARRPDITVTKVAQLRGHKDAVYDFDYDKSTDTLYSAGADGYVVAWDLSHTERDGKLILTTSEALYSLFVNENRLKAGSRSGTIYSVDLTHKTLESQTKIHQGGVFFIRDTISGGEDGFLMNDGNLMKVAQNSLRGFTEDENRYYIGCSDNNIYAVDNDIRGEVTILSGHTNSVFALEFLDQNTLVSTGRDAMIRAWDLTLGTEVHAVPAHDYQAKSLSWNGRILLSSSMDKTIKLWNDKLDLWKVIDFERYSGHTNCINKVLWIDENMFVSCSDDRSLCLWKVEIMP